MSLYRQKQTWDFINIKRKCNRISKTQQRWHSKIWLGINLPWKYSTCSSMNQVYLPYITLWVFFGRTYTTKFVFYCFEKSNIQLHLLGWNFMCSLNCCVMIHKSIDCKSPNPLNCRTYSRYFTHRLRLKNHEISNYMRITTFVWIEYQSIASWTNYILVYSEC